jgi:hypothetical protein
MHRGLENRSGLVKLGRSRRSSTYHVSLPKLFLLDSTLSALMVDGASWLCLASTFVALFSFILLLSDLQGGIPELSGDRLGGLPRALLVKSRTRVVL